MTPKDATLAVLLDLERAARRAARLVAAEGFDLSHGGHAERIDLAARLSAVLTAKAAEAIHAVNLMAIGHDLVDRDFADAIASRIEDACMDEYDLAFDRQRELAAAERREERAGNRHAA